MNKRSVVRFLVLACTLFMGGCSLMQSSVPPEQRVAELAQERLDLLIAGQVERSYAYTTPGYRSARTWQEYAPNWIGSSMWTSASVTKVDCGDLEPAQRCEVAVKVVFTPPRMDTVHTFMFEQWLRLDGEWYLYQKP